MFRVAMVGENSHEWLDAAQRLRGIELQPAAPTAGDAVLVLDAARLEPLLASGQYLLVEAASLTDTRLAEFVRLDSPRLLILNRGRFLPSRQLIRQQLAGHLGEPGLIRLHHWAASLEPMALLCDLDLVAWMMTAPPSLVHALRGDGGLHIHLGFSSGGMALLTHASGGHLAAGYDSLSVIASAGAAYANDQSNRPIHFAGQGVPSSRVNEGKIACAAMLQSFADAVARGDDLSASRAAWRQALAVRDAVNASLASGRPCCVEVPQHG